MKVAVFQHDACLNGPEERFSWMQSNARKHAQADLLVFPELFLSGYNVGENLQRYAEPSDGPFASRVKSLARELGVAILYGYPERAADAVFNSAVIIDSTGQVLANHRKSILPDGIEQKWLQTGKSLTVFEFDGSLVALMICYECEFPETVRRVASLGAEVVLVCTACGWDQVPNLVVPSRAYENGVFMVYANIAGVENGHPFTGLSCIVDPYGRDLARAAKAEAVISAALDMSTVAEARKKLPYLRDHLKTPTTTHQEKQ